jgi:hypothetical protein
MIELTEFQHKVLAFLGKLDELAVYARWPSEQWAELDQLHNEGLLFQINEIHGLFQLTERGKAMFKDSGSRAIQ